MSLDSLAESSLSAYKRDMEVFCAFYKKPINALEHEDIIQYLAHLMDEGASRATIARRFATLRGFCNFLCANRKARTNVTFGIKLEHEHNVRGVVPSYTDVRAVAESLSMGSVERVVFELCALGLRTSEVTALTVGDIDLPAATIQMSRREVKMTSDAWDAVNAYWSIHHADAKADHALIMTQQGPDCSRQFIWKTIKRVSQGRLNAMDLRRACVFELLKSGLSDEAVQAQAGFADKTTIDRYRRAG